LKLATQPPAIARALSRCRDRYAALEERGLKRAWWLPLFLLLMPAHAPAADLYRLTSDNTRITFTVRLLGLTLLSAHFGEFSGDLVPDRRVPPSRVDVSIRTASLTCENPRWNEQLLSPVWFDAQHYPQISYHSEQVRFDSARGGTVSGQLTLHGQTHAFELTVKQWLCTNQSGAADTCSFDAEGRIRRSDFGLPHGILEGGDEVIIEIRGEAVRPAT
jgi:polyisoprenoid-binding protein YceI